jgi:CheY-like chemotaxis protein/HPt (histidine-containing phosphotransfer) domain-containing protein/anti-sigma regulatory factor (Ser/Thr protein kinase)
VNTFGIPAAAKGLALQTVVAPGLPALLLGDPQRLVQVLSNLVGNAVKFTAAGSIQLEVRGRRQTEAVVDLEMTVRDTGIGMTDEELSRLFTVFSQADASTTRRFGGSGLGLAISRSLAELMGGTLRAESTYGQGSLFTVLLSCQIVTGLERPEVPRLLMAPRQRFTGIQALVVEDQAINRQVLVELLRQLEITVDTASNGREAVELVRARDYDILFMDIQMPVLDGLTATREIRQLEKDVSRRLPILAITAHALSGEREKSLDAGMDDHLTKPIDRHALVAALGRWLPRDTATAVSADDGASAPRLAPLSVPSTAGLDVEEALNRLGGDWDFYVKLLREFLGAHGEAPALLLQDLRADRRAEAARRAHAIRGIAANLGGTDLEAAATELERACLDAGNAGDAMPFALGKPLRVFIDCHQALIADIGAVLAGQPVTPPIGPAGPPGDAAELCASLARLKAFLENKEPWPCKELLGTLLNRTWPANQESALTELNRLVERYRLADALAFLNKEFPNVRE